jgi:FtsZ-binding cell division protein ZapB
MDNNEIIRVNGTIDGTIYAKGDTCLLINPFDTYHLFRVYNNWNTDSKALLNLSDGGQKLYLVFKNKKTEIRIPEFTNFGSNFQTDKSNGEVLFKISKENANSILAMNTNSFYITRVFEYEDGDGKVIYTSGEEVIFTGNWADENKWTGASLTATIETLKKQLESANSQISDLTGLVNEYKLKIESLSDENTALQDRINALEAENDELQNQISNYEEGNEFTSVVISDNATYQYYKGDEEVDEKGNSIKKEIDKETEQYIKENGKKVDILPMTETQLSEKVNNSKLNAVGNKKKTITTKYKTL